MVKLLTLDKADNNSFLLQIRVSPIRLFQLNHCANGSICCWYNPWNEKRKHSVKLENKSELVSLQLTISHNVMKNSTKRTSVLHRVSKTETSRR